MSSTYNVKPSLKANIYFYCSFLFPKNIFRYIFSSKSAFKEAIATVNLRLNILIEPYNFKDIIQYKDKIEWLNAVKEELKTMKNLKYPQDPTLYHHVGYLVQYLVEHEEDVNKRNEYGEIPLLKVTKSKNKELVKYLLENGTDINKENEYGETPLFKAIESGADVNKENKEYKTPLFYACETGNKELVKHLVKHGADINKENKECETSLSKAIESEDIELIEYLVELCLGFKSIFRVFNIQKDLRKEFQLDTDNTDPTASEDSILTLSRKSSRMNSLIDALPSFEVVVFSDRLEEERRNLFIIDSKQGVVTCSYLDVIDGVQHEVTPTADPEWVDIEGIGQVNKYLVGLLGLWKGLQYKYETLQEIFDSGGTQFTKTQIRKAKREYLSAELNEQTKGDLLKLNESTDKKIEALKVELNHNIAIAGNTALKAIEQNEETKVLVTNNANEEQNKLSNFLKEFDTRASQFQNEIGALEEDNKKLFDMIQSVAGTALTSKDIKDMKLHGIQFYQSQKTNSKEQINTLLTLCGNLERGLNQHQKKFDSFLKNLQIDYEKSLASVKEIAVAAISDSKLPEKLALTTHLDENAKKTLNNIVKTISKLASTIHSLSSNANSNILKALSLCNDTINFYKNFTTNHDTCVSSKDGQILTRIITNAIDDIFARIENIIPSNVTVMPNSISNKEIFNYNIYLDTISRYPKTAILFDYKMDSNGFISDISIKKKFEAYTHNLLNYIFRKYNSDDLSSMASLKTADVFNLPYRKEPEPIVVPPPPLDVPMASTSSPKLINIPSISDSEDLTKLTKENTEFNEADSSKYFPSRALYREYKVLDSNVAEWAKSTAVKLSASNKRVSFQIPYKLTFSDSSSDLANDPFYLPKKYSISKNPSFLVTLKMLTTSKYLCSAFLSCLPSHQRNYFYNKFLPARGHIFKQKFATYSIEEAQKIWNNLKIDKNHLDVFETKINKIAKVLKISDYAKGLKEEAIKKNICFSTFSDDNFEPIMRFVNKMALEERVLQDQRTEYLQLSGVMLLEKVVLEVATKKPTNSTKTHNSCIPDIRPLKKEIKIKKRRQASYFNIVEASNSDDSETESDDEIDVMKEQFQDFLKSKGEELQQYEVQCTNEVSHYFIDEMFTPDPKYFTSGLELQKTIDKLQVSAPWKITKYAEAYVNPIITRVAYVNRLWRPRLQERHSFPFVVKLVNRIHETNDEEFLNAVPQYSSFLGCQESPVCKMTQRKYKIPIDRIEEFFPTDYRIDQDEPGNNPAINETIENAMQTQLTGYPLEELSESIENNLETLHPRRFNGDQNATTWREIPINSTARVENEEFRRRIRERNEEILNVSNYYDVSFHNILSEIAQNDESELLNLQRDLHRNEVTLTNEKTINNKCRTELKEFKDVFKVPRGIPPSRGKWDFKLNISKEDISKLLLAKPKITSKEASIATKEMIKNYQDEGWIEPSVLPHAVNMFPVPKHDGSFRYVYNYVPVNKICDIAENSIPNLREQVNE
ncbi:hypothetical protein U3516DRAFT_732330 [Neocallimastix sp. 'constans']